MDDAGLVFDARMTESNTGLLKGQGILDVTVYPPRESPILLRRTAHPATVAFDPDAGSMRMVNNQLVQGERGWTLHVREGREALDATLQLVPRAAAIPPATLVQGQEQWLLGAPVPRAQVTGVWRAGAQGGMLEGWAVLLRESNDTFPKAQPARRSFHVLTPTMALGIEEVGGEALSWLVDASGQHVGGSASFQRKGRRLSISLAPDLPVEISALLSRSRVQRHPWEHLNFLERPLARLAAGWPQRTYERAKAVITVDGVATETRALFVHGSELPDPARRNRNKQR